MHSVPVPVVSAVLHAKPHRSDYAKPTRDKRHPDPWCRPALGQKAPVVLGCFVVWFFPGLG